MIRIAAEDVQKEPKWKDDKNIQEFVFSNHWVYNFLCRAMRTKHKTQTTTADKLPPDQDIAKHFRKMINYYIVV